jgi:hypothetical protein
MKTTTGITLLSAAALLGPATVTAAENLSDKLPWTDVEGAYLRVDGTEEFEVDAYALNASVGFAGIGHAQLEYLDGEADDDSSSSFSDDADFDGYRLIAGVHPAINDDTQARFDVTYFDYETDFDAGGDASQDGYGLGFGLRHAFSPKFEGTAEVWYVEGDTDFGSGSEDFNDISLEFQGRYNWTPNLSVGLTYLLNGGVFGSAVNASSSSSSNGDVARFDVRWSFGYNGLSDIK